MKTLALIATLLAQAQPMPDIRSTRHNLSSSGTNPVHAVSEDGVCVFCHIPHKAAKSRPTWNRDLSYQTAGLYNVYTSTTLDSAVGQPNGAAKLCLSCHDGTLAIGSLLNDNLGPASVQMANGVTTMPAGPRNLGTDLRNDHPVSMVPNVAGDPEIVLPPAGDDVQLKEGATAGVKDTVQCTSCHDPHLPTYKFLVKSNTRGALCTTCHQKPGWIGSAHEQSMAAYPATGAQVVGDLACLSCHAPHNGQSPSRLLQTSNQSFGSPFPWAEENVCFSCHQAGGTGVDPNTGRAAPDIKTQFGKTTHHPVELATDQHQPVFTAHLPEPETVLNSNLHVECMDCHNPHQVRPLPGNVHEGMKGISISGATVVDNASVDLKQYEICLRCHGDTFATFIPPASTRPPSGSNKRTEFQPGNGAFHPVAATGRNQSSFLNNVLDAPDGQLKGNDWQGNRLSRSSTVLCTDCHNSESTGNVNGSARGSSFFPKGPHGSANQRILRANYSFAVGSMTTGAPFPSYSTANFALCFLCHDEQRLRGVTVNRSNFYQPGGVGAGRGNLHDWHLNQKTHANCMECHYNIHSNVEAANTDYKNLSSGSPSHLINFAPTVAAFNPKDGADPYYGDNPTKPRYGRTPSGQPYCFLQCHGSNKMNGTGTTYAPPNP